MSMWLGCGTQNALKCDHEHRMAKFHAGQIYHRLGHLRNALNCYSSVSSALWVRQKIQLRSHSSAKVARLHHVYAYDLATMKQL